MQDNPVDSSIQQRYGMEMETQKIEATIKIEMIISNTNDAPALKIDAVEAQKIEAAIKMEMFISSANGAPVLKIDKIETTDVIINKTKVTPVTEIETIETMVTIIKVTRKTCHGIHITPIQIFYPNR